MRKKLLFSGLSKTLQAKALGMDESVDLWMLMRYVCENSSNVNVRSSVLWLQSTERKLGGTYIYIVNWDNWKRNNIYSLIKVWGTANKCVFMPKMFWSTAAKEKLRALWNNTESIHRGGFEKEKNSIFILSIQVYLKYITSEALSMLASIQQSIFVV